MKRTFQDVMSITHLPVHLSFLFVAVDSGTSQEELHTVEVRATLDQWSQDALKAVCNGSKLDSKSITSVALGAQLLQRCQSFLNEDATGYADVDTEYEFRTPEENNSHRPTSAIHLVQSRVQLHKGLILDGEERTINFIADLFDGFAKIEIIERIDGHEHFMHMTSGKGKLESTQFFKEASLSIHMQFPRSGEDHTFCLAKTSPVLQDYFDELPARSRATPGARRDATLLLIESEIQDALGHQGLHGFEFEVEDRSQQTGVPTMTFTIGVPEAVKLDFGRLVSDLTESPLGLLQSD